MTPAQQGSFEVDKIIPGGIRTFDLSNEYSSIFLRESPSSVVCLWQRNSCSSSFSSSLACLFLLNIAITWQMSFFQSSHITNESVILLIHWPVVHLCRCGWKKTCPTSLIWAVPTLCWGGLFFSFPSFLPSFALFLRQGVTVYHWLSWNSLYQPV